MILTVKHLWPYHYRRHVNPWINHVNLNWLCLQKDPSNRVTKWLEFLAEFRHSLEHRAEVRHEFASELRGRGRSGCQLCLHIECRHGGISHCQAELPSSRMSVNYCTKTPTQLGTTKTSQFNQDILHFLNFNI